MKKLTTNTEIANALNDAFKDMGIKAYALKNSDGFEGAIELSEDTEITFGSLFFIEDDEALENALSRTLVDWLDEFNTRALDFENDEDDDDETGRTYWNMPDYQRRDDEYMNFEYINLNESEVDTLETIQSKIRAYAANLDNQK